MSVTTTARLALNQWSAGTDPVTRAQRNADNLALENNAAMDAQGTLAGRPTVGKRGRFYWATDSSRLFRDDGTSWNEIATLTSGGALSLASSPLVRTGQILLPFSTALAVDDGLSGYARFGSYAGAAAMMTENASYNASGQWVRDTVANGASKLSIDQTGALLLEIAAAGSNPITWTSRLQVSSNGVLSLTADHHQFGVGSLGGSGTYIGIGDYGNAAIALVQALGSPTNVGLVLQSKGTGQISLSVGGGVHTPITVGYPGNIMGLGFFDQSPQAKQTVSGSKGGNAALASLIAVLVTYGLISDSST